MSRRAWAVACCVVVMGWFGVGCGDDASRADPAVDPDAEANRAVCGRYPERLDPEERIEAEREIVVLPLSRQLVVWRALGACAEDVALRSDALRQLARLEDPVGVSLSIRALGDGSHALRASAATALAHYGSPTADVARPALRTALAQADERDERQLVWSLVVLREPTVFARAVGLWRRGELTRVERIDGGSAFDPDGLAELAPEESLGRLARDEQPSLRALAAIRLGEHPSSSSRALLLDLVRDAEPGVAAAAAGGLCQLEGDDARQAVVEELAESNEGRRLAILEGLREHAGGPGLVVALRAIAREPSRQNHPEVGRVLHMMRELGDPRIRDPLVAWLDAEGHRLPPGWRAEAALRLAEVGDERAARLLGEAIATHDESRDRPSAGRGRDVRLGAPSVREEQRIEAAHRLADLAEMHPERHGELAESAGRAVLDWTIERPLPDAGALRFLARVDYVPARAAIERWAFATGPLPETRGSRPGDRSLEIAGPALRAIGTRGAADALPRLLAELDRIPRSASSRSPYGLALRSRGKGAIEGLSELGAAAGTDVVTRLLRLAQDDGWHEDVRLAACRALGYVGDDATPEHLIARIEDADEDDDRVAICLAEALGRRARPEHTQALVALLRSTRTPLGGLSVGRAVAATGWASSAFAAEIEGSLLGLLADPDRSPGAALALLLGGSPEGAGQAATFVRKMRSDGQQLLREAYRWSIASVEEGDVARGNVDRWVANALAIERLARPDDPLPWMRRALTQELHGRARQAGPHTLSRWLLRYRLVASARAGVVPAVTTLSLLAERGSLMALRAEGGAIGAMADRALCHGPLE